MPRLIERLGESLGLEHFAVTRDYRLTIVGPATAACYLQGVNEATHGIADSLLSVLAHRSAEIASDIITHRVNTTSSGPRFPTELRLAS
jgi:L-ornithine N5-oxygenase